MWPEKKYETFVDVSIELYLGNMIRKKFHNIRWNRFDSVEFLFYNYLLFWEVFVWKLRAESEQGLRHEIGENFSHHEGEGVSKKIINYSNFETISSLFEYFR